MLEQLRRNELEGLERIAALAATESAVIPDLPLSESKYKRGFASANKHLQMNKWAFHSCFAGSTIDEITGKSLEYRDLVKDPKLVPTWHKSLANELGRLAHGIRDVKGMDTIFLFPNQRYQGIDSRR